MTKVFCTNLALLDIGNIRRHHQRYSQENANEFIEGLNDTLDLIALFPGKGRARDDISTGMRTHVYRRHVIFYSLIKVGILIERIASPGQDQAALFN